MSNIATSQTAERWLHQVLGADARFRPGQLEAITGLVDKQQRMLVVQRTGWGKSMVYFIATRLLRSKGSGPTILISPLLSLMRNQIEAANTLGVRAASINSANDPEDNAYVESRLLDDDIDLLLISPERLANQHFRDLVWENIRHHVGLLVVDEAHCISDWGHDFRPDYRRIMRVLGEIPSQTPVLATTATANDRVVADVSEILGANLQVLRGPLTRDSLLLYVFPEPRPISYRLVLLSHLLSSIEGSGIIYCMTTRDCVRVSKWLNHQGFNTKPYYAQVEQETGEDRIELEKQLLNNDVKALVASVALGMGFDKPDLHFVIHYQHPGSIIGYYQQIGRAGRGIDRAHIILMHGLEDEEIQQYFIETAFPKPEHVQQVLNALLQAEDGGLTRNQLMGMVNVRMSTLDKILTHLEIENIIEKQDRAYCVIDAQRQPDYARWEQVGQQRQVELADMQAYIRHQGCFMQFIANALDDPRSPQPCGKCKNCRRVESKFVADPQLIEEASRFLRDGENIVFDPRKQWPSGISETRRGRLRQTNAAGVALCHYHDQGWAELVKQGRYTDNHFSDELVKASAALLTRHFETLENPPTWVTSVASLRRPVLVPDFAQRLAHMLGLDYQRSVQNIHEHPEQRTAQNSWQQATNVLDAFAVENVSTAPVLLIDDLVDSNWTLTIIGQLLMQQGCAEVYPFVLAKL